MVAVTLYLWSYSIKKKSHSALSELNYSCSDTAEHSFPLNEGQLATSETFKSQAQVKLLVELE